MKTLPVSMTHNEKLLGWFFWGLQMVVIPPAITLWVTAFAPTLGMAERNFIYLALSFLAMSAIMLRFLKECLVAFFARPFHALRRAGIAYMLYWASFFAVKFLLRTISPTFQNINDANTYQLLQENPALMTISVLLLAPIAEELIYRGVIFGSIHEHNLFAAYALSCIAFSAVHVVGYVGQWDTLNLVLCFFQYLPAGFCFAWAYDRSGTIWAPILMHIAINQTVILSWR